MTRKRVNQTGDGSSNTPEGRNLQRTFDARHPKRRNTFGDDDTNYQQYGYQESSSQNEHDSNGFQNNSFPRKNRFLQQYDHQEYPSQNEQYTEVKTQNEYPKELVSYLRNMNRQTAENPLEDLAIEKCIDEVKGSEEALLKYPESAGVVETFFGSNSRASLEFLKLIIKLKHKTMIDMMFSGCGSKTIETLIYEAIKTSGSNDLLTVLNVFVEIICENWIQLAFATNSCFIIRSLLRISTGFTQRIVKQTGKEKGELQLGGKNVELERLLRHNYTALSQLVFDYRFFQDATEVECASLLFQEAVKCEANKSPGRIDSLIDKAITEAQNDSSVFLVSWKSRVASRIWEQLATGCSEDARGRLWMSFIGPNVSSLVTDEFANFPLQKLIASVKSLELATDVFDELSTHLTQLFTSEKFGVVRALITSISKFDDLQNSFLKVLRKYFNANKEANKINFLCNILTMNGCVSEKFGVSSVVPRGSFLAESLLDLSRTKTIGECIKAMPKETLFALSIHRIASHFIEAVFTTKNLDTAIKLHVASAYEGKWPLLIDSPYGSHVFEKLWDSEAFPIDLKANFLKQIRNNMPKETGKFWKFMLYRTKYHLFNTKRDEWAKEWKKDGEITKNEKGRMEKIKKKAEKKKLKADAKSEE